MNVYVLELSRELAKKGHTVDIFTRSTDTHNPKVVQVSEQLRVIHLVAGPERPISKKNLLQYIPEFVQSYKEFVGSEHLSYDVMHCHYYLSGLIGLQICKVPLVMTFHTLALMKNLVARGEVEKEDGTRIEAELELVQKVDKIITPSTSDTQYLQYLYDAKPNKLSVIPPGVDPTIFRPIPQKEAKAFVGADPNSKMVMFVGRIEALKGIDMLMYAIKIFVKKNPPVPICLWIVGGDISQHMSLWSKELQKLEELRHTLQLRTVVKFVGQRPQDELPYYYNAADVVVMPSHYESFGMAALEAMMCGVPVITTNVAGISSVLADTDEVLLTTVNDPIGLATKIEFLLKNPAAHEQLSTEVREKVQDLTWANIANQVLRVYESAVQTGRKNA